MLRDWGKKENKRIRNSTDIFIGGGKDCISGDFWNALKYFNNEKNRKEK